MSAAAPWLLPPDDYVRPATQDDLEAVIALQRHWRDDVSYVPRSAHREHIDRGDTTLVYRRGDPAGYVMAHAHTTGLAHIVQVAVHPDVLRSTLGSLLMHDVHARLTDKGARTIRLRSRIDLPANLFWPGFGYAVTGRYTARTKRAGELLEWTRLLRAPYTPPHERQTPTS